MVFGKTINDYYKKYWIYFLIGVIFLVIVDYAQIEIPVYLRNIIDGLVQGTIEEEGILENIGWITVMAGIIIVGRFLWRVSLLQAARRINFDMRNQLSGGHVNQHCVGASPQSGQASGNFSHKTPKIFNIISRINNLRNI